MKSVVLKKYTVLLLTAAILCIPLSGCSSPAYKRTLESWNTDSPNKEKIISFVKAVSDKNSKEFVPEEDRVAVFDFDGTIICEEPLLFELAVAEYRILNELKDNTQLVKDVTTLNDYLVQYPPPPEVVELRDDILCSAFEGMPQEEYIKYVENFKQNDFPGFYDLKYKDIFYKPMLELIDYLIANNFQVYIVSSSQRAAAWSMCKGVLPLSRTNFIGTDVALKVSNQTDTTDGSYIWNKNDEFLRESWFEGKGYGISKALNIYRNIGVKPILAFGNTDEDFSMLNFTKSNDKYRNIAFLLCHDDNAVEYDTNSQQRQEWSDLANANDWNVVSLSSEFTQVFMRDAAKK